MAKVAETRRLYNAKLTATRGPVGSPLYLLRTRANFLNSVSIVDPDFDEDAWAEEPTSEHLDYLAETGDEETRDLIRSSLGYIAR